MANPSFMPFKKVGVVKGTSVIKRKLPVISSPPLPAKTFTSYYDPSRIMKGIKVVKDLRDADTRINDTRQNGAERGEMQSGDSGVLGPSANVKTKAVTNKSTSENKSPLISVALAIAAYLLLGG